MARFTSAILVAAFCFALAPTLAARADPIDDLEAQIARDQAALAALQDQTLAVDAQIADVQGRIGRLQALLADLNSQLLAANARLSDEQEQLNMIQQAEDRAAAELARTENELQLRQSQFASQLRLLDKVEKVSPFKIVLTSGSFSDFLGRIYAIRQISDGTHALAVQVKAARDRVAALRAELEVQRARQSDVVGRMQADKQRLEKQYALETAATNQLAVLQARLGQQQEALVGQASDLSAEIASAEAQIAAILAFSRGQGGGNIVAPEYLSSAWGNYYNQRDARWGDNYVGRSPYLVWEIGCLLSSVAMVNTHFGYRRVTPGTIAADPNNFTSGGLLYNFALDVPGHPATINNNPSRAWINNYLANGGTVIVGMFIRSGGTHFVVLTGMNGPYDYWINDPWMEDAMHVSYNSSLVTGPIYTAIGYW